MKTGRPKNIKPPQKISVEGIETPDMTNLTESAKETRRQEISKAVLIIESKPHVRYIRYLLTKKTSPRFISSELYKIGLSAASESVMIDYYFAVIDPLVKSFGLSKIYSDYRKKLTQRKLKSPDKCQFVYDILKYKLQVAENADLAARFCEFVKALEIDAIWMQEIFQAHGCKTENMPVNKAGERILNVSSPGRAVDKILNFEHRHVVEQLILEGVPDTRIAKYCRETLKSKITDNDVALYRTIFFNTQLNSIEKNIEILNNEKRALTAILSDVNRGIGRFRDADIGTRKTYRDQLKIRVNELDETLRTLKMAHTDIAYNKNQLDVANIEKMFGDIIMKSHERYNELNAQHDRDIPGLQSQVVKIMATAYDKWMDARERIGPNGGISKDKDVQTQFGEIYKKRLDDIISEDKEKANEALKAAGFSEFEEDIDLNEIEGVDELGINVTDAEELDEDNKKQEE